MLEGTIREQLVEKAAVESDFLCPFRPKVSSRRALVSMRKAPLVWSTVAMPSVSSLVSDSSAPRSRRSPKRFKPEDRPLLWIAPVHRPFGPGHPPTLLGGLDSGRRARGAQSNGWRPAARILARHLRAGGSRPSFSGCCRPGDASREHCACTPMADAPDHWRFHSSRVLGFVDRLTRSGLTVSWECTFESH